MIKFLIDNVLKYYIVKNALMQAVLYGPPAKDFPVNVAVQQRV